MLHQNVPSWDWRNQPNKIRTMKIKIWDKLIQINRFDHESGTFIELHEVDCNQCNALCVFGKRGPKMFNFELLFLHGFSSKNREILHKAVLTPQEFEDYFFGEKKLRKKWGKNQKTCWGCLFKLRLVSKKSSRKKNFFLESTLFEQTPPSSKKMGF